MKKLGNKLVGFICLVIVLGVVYAILCAVIGDDTFYPNTSINGIDVSNMTVSEAASTVEEQFEKEYGNATMTVVLNGTYYNVDITSAIDIDVLSAVQKANDDNHLFFSRGINYVKALFAEQEYTASPALSDKDSLYTAVEATGITNEASSDENGYELTDTSIIIIKGQGMYMVNEDELVELLADAIEVGDYTVTIECPITYGDIDLQTIYDVVCTEPADATIETDSSADNGYVIIDSVDGVSFDLAAAQSMLDSASDGDEVVIDLVFTEAELTSDVLQTYIFRDVLGSWSTTVTGTSNRKTNVRLASEKVNGTIIPSGGQFSYNDVVGQRTLANGFLEAPAYSNGDSVDEVGGGICQVSTTLYIAALYANLQIDQRTNHSYPSSYAAMGLDATVSWGGPEFIFTNDTDYPIKIVSSYGDDGKIYVYIYGTRTSEFKVEITTETVATYPYETVYEDDDTLEEGEEEVETSGHTGYKVISYRTVYDGDGNVIYSGQEAVSTYKKQNRVIRRGTKKSDDEEEDEDADEEDEEATTEKSSKKKTTTEEATTEKSSKKKTTTEEATTEKSSKKTTEATTEATTKEATTTEATTTEATTEAAVEASEE